MFFDFVGINTLGGLLLQKAEPEEITKSLRLGRDSSTNRAVKYSSPTAGSTPVPASTTHLKN
jgi:hypothetical protein